jgi:hypothetical protein
MLREVEKKAAEMGWKLEWKPEPEGPDHEPTFTTSCIMFGREIAREQGRSKDEAKERAACAAFKTFKEEEPSQFGQMIAERVLYKFRELWTQRVHSEAPNPTVIAGIVEEDAGDYKVVSIGAGTAHRLWDDMDERPNRVLNDCHAEILARRALHKHFYRELENAHAMQQQSAMDSSSQQQQHGPASAPVGAQHISSIFTRNSGASRYALRPGVRYHMYIRCVYIYTWRASYARASACAHTQENSCLSPACARKYRKGSMMKYFSWLETKKNRY